MSRLDQHVRLVRNKMAFSTLLRAWAWAGILFGIVVLLTIVVIRLTQFHLPRPAIWFWGGLGAAAVAGVVYAMARRPSARHAAVAIDEKLALKEKFSTALYLRPSKDPFAAAAVRDAERTAEQVSLHKRFPVEPPRAAWGTVGVAFAALGVAWLMPTFDLFGVQQARKVHEQQRIAQVAQADVQIKRAIAAIEAAPEKVQADEQIRLASKELPDLLHQASRDPVRSAKRAEEAMKELDAIKQKVQAEKQYAEAQRELENLKNLGAPSPDETGPVADAHRALAEGKLDQAMTDLKKAVDNFDKMDAQQQQKTAQQMQQLAQQIAQQANNPQTQQQIQQQMQKQLQQAGVNQKQAQQMAQQMQQLMQQAANGNQQAAQQLAQMAKQAAQQANQKQGLSPQQQQQIAQQIQKAVQKAQQQANSQANSQAMQQAAQSLAKAMQQASQQGQKGQQGNQGQRQQQQARSGTPGQQQGGRPGQGAGQQQQQQMAQAAQAMQQQLQQLQAQANGAAGVTAAQQAAQNAQNGQPGQGQGQNPNGQQANGQWGKNNNPGQWQPGKPNPQQAQGGQGGPAVAAAGRRPDPSEAPFAVKTEYSQSQTDDKGKILASSLVKAPAEKGESKMTLNQVAESAMKEATDEVGQDRIPRGAWNAVKGYFDTMKNHQSEGK
jgi:hypothetical protein